MPIADISPTRAARRPCSAVIFHAVLPFRMRLSCSSAGDRIFSAVRLRRLRSSARGAPSEVTRAAQASFACRREGRDAPLSRKALRSPTLHAREIELVCSSTAYRQLSFRLVAGRARVGCGMPTSDDAVQSDFGRGDAEADAAGAFEGSALTPLCIPPAAQRIALPLSYSPAHVRHPRTGAVGDDDRFSRRSP